MPFSKAAAELLARFAGDAKREKKMRRCMKESERETERERSEKEREGDERACGLSTASEAVDSTRSFAGSETDAAFTAEKALCHNWFIRTRPEERSIVHVMTGFCPFAGQARRSSTAQGDI